MSLDIEKAAFQLPKDWKLKTLGDVADINMGQSPSSSAYNDLGKGKYLIQGNADIKNRKTVPRTWTTEFPKVCQEGDILMTVRAPVGAIARSLHNACLGRGVCAITSDNVDNEYLYQFLLSHETKWAAIEQGSTFTAVNGKDIRGIEIPLPPLPEQQKIAEILSAVDEKMAVIDEQLAQTQEIKRGLMQRLLTKGIGHSAFKDSPLGGIPESWEVKELREVGSLVGGCAFSAKLFNNTGDGYQVVRMSNVQSYGLELKKNPVFLSSITQKEEKYLLQENDVLITLTGTLGKKDYGNVAFIKESNKLLLNQRVGRFNYKKSIVGKYLFFVFHSAYFREEFFASGKGGTGNQANVGKSDFEGIKVAIPPLPEQHQIAEILTTVDDKLQILTDKKAQYQEFKRGLMQQLLTGQRRVRVAQQEEALA